MQSTLIRNLLFGALAALAVWCGLQIVNGGIPRGLVLGLLPVVIAASLGMLSRPHLLGFVLVGIFYINLDVWISKWLEAHLAFIFLFASVAYMALLMMTRGERAPIGQPYKWFGAFFAVAATTTAMMPDTAQGDVLQWIQIIVYSFNAFTVGYLLLSRPERLRQLSVMLTWLGVVLSIINLIEFMDRSLISMSSTPGRSAGLLINANPSAAAILACFIISYMRPQRFMLVARLLMFGGIFTTFSRSELMLSVIFLLYNELLVSRLRVRMSIVSLLLIGMVVMIMENGSYFVDRSETTQVKYAYTRIENAREGNFDDSSTRFRRRAITINFGRFLEHPFFGGGGSSASQIDAPHNELLLVLAEHGAVGMFLFGGFLISLLRRLMRLAPGPERRVLMLLFWFQVLNMFFTHGEYHERFFMLIFAIIAAGAEVCPVRVEDSSTAPGPIPAQRPFRRLSPPGLAPGLSRRRPVRGVAGR